MTYLYDRKSFPDQLAIACLRCRKDAIFLCDEFKFLPRLGAPISGQSTCIHCGHNGRHEIKWPNDAYYKVSVRHKELWASSRDEVVVLLDYLSSGSRKQYKTGHGWFLLHVPAVFKTAKIRGQVVFKLEKLLSLNYRSTQSQRQRSSIR